MKHITGKKIDMDNLLRMKALPRRYIWWPGLHKEIEEAARTC